MSSLIVPVIAKCIPTSSLSNFGHNTPGVSNSSILSFILIHCFCFVTPGLFPTSADVFFAILFINEDFPTFGIPTIITLIFLPIRPLSAIFFRSSSISFCISLIVSFIPFPDNASTNIAF